MSDLAIVSVALGTAASGLTLILSGSIEVGVALLVGGGSTVFSMFGLSGG